MNFEHFISWDYLKTFAGVVTMVCLIVQLTKTYIDKLPFSIPTQVYSYVLSVIIMLVVEIFEVGGNGLKLSEAVLILFNGFIVSAASNGSYDIVNRFVNTDTKKPK